ncbi:hypothetical protein C2G38_2187423 [Gigaspora rosea]|uniref:Uncharacterized protein n=1 Tax=Gigaspora rosea TaxID=44941 RepID=A0A397VBK2_9GLOM|nr:hypothetical protein C2G38_2187423 [Gigaspora rosea]
MHHLSKLFARPFLSRSNRRTSRSNLPDSPVPDNQVQVLDNQAPDSQAPNSQIAIFEETYQQELEYFLNEPPNQWSWYKFLKHLDNKGILKDSNHANPLYLRCLEHIVDNLTYTEEMRKFAKKNLNKKELKKQKTWVTRFWRNYQFENVELSVDDGGPSTLKRAQTFSDDMKNSSNEASLSDDNPINSATSRKLSNIGGIARYYKIFLPECNKKDFIRKEFSDDEWNALENTFSQPELSKHVLNDEASSEYQYRSRFVNLLCEDIFLDLNNIIRLSTGEVENIYRKIQKDLSKHPNEQKSIGWYHDGVLKININGTEMQAGFLEVVGNAIVEDYKKKVDDRIKVLKAMWLAFSQLEDSLYEKGVAGEELKQKLETFGIIVDRRHFVFYFDGVYLVDEIFSFTLPDMPTQLYLLKDIINILLKFRARVEHLYNQINVLLSMAFQENIRPQWITVLLKNS